MARVRFGFEGLASRGGTDVLPFDEPLSNGLTFFNFQAVDRTANVRGDGIQNVIEAGSGRAAATNFAPITATVVAEEGTFDLRSGVFAAATVEDLTLTVTGFRDGVEVAQRTFTLGQEAEVLRFGQRFHDLDVVTFETSGGSRGDFATGGGDVPFALGPIVDPLANNFFAVDNLVIDTHTSDLMLLG